MSALEARGLQVSYGKNRVLAGVDLDVASGDTLVLFGPSGAGKTVLLRAIAGLEPSATGYVGIGGRPVASLGPERRRIGVAFQNFALYPHMTAAENIASPLHARRLGRSEIDAKVAAIAGLLKIAHVLDHQPRALSNGQKQRTALARALVANPDVLLLDDPLRNVDAKLRYEMRMELPRLLRDSGAASIYVSQDFREAMALADRVAVLIGGRIVQCAPPEEIYDEPANVEVARLFGDPPMNLLACRPSSGGVDAVGLSVPVPAAGPATLGIRPDAIEVSSSPLPGGALAVLEAATPLHERTVLLLRAETGDEVLASVDGDAPAEGSRIWFRPDPARVLLYDTATGQRMSTPSFAVEHA